MSGNVSKVCFEIKNLGKNFSKENVLSKLTSLGVVGESITKITKGPSTCRVSLNSTEEKQKAMQLISSQSIITDEAEGPWTVKSIYIHQPRVHLKDDKKKEFEAKKAADAVASWREIPYPEQLDKKQTTVSQALATFSTVVPQSILASPAIHGYRNKLDFTIGVNLDEKPCAGFRVGSFKQGGVSSFRVDVDEGCLFTAPANGLEVARFLSEYMQQESRLAVYDQHTHKGFWRALTVRCSEVTQEILVIVRACPDVPGGEEEMQKCVHALKTFGKITSCYWQWWEGIAFQAPSEDTGFELCFGKPVLEEHVLSMKFEISPGAFFQVNTRGCEVMFTLLRSMLTQSPKALVLDLCCGTGVIGLLLAQQVHSVVGVELSLPAVLNARRNAANNGLSEKTSFICAKAETVLARLLTGKAKTMLAKSDSQLSEKDEEEMVRAIQWAKEAEEIIVVVDPPRSGLHPSVLKALLRCKEVNRILYVSCNPTGSFVENAKVLCGNQPIISHKQDVRESEGILPFEPVQFIPVDMFPHTEHCELVAEFRRVKEEDHVKRLKTGE